MAWVAVAVGGATLVNGYMQSKAVGSAADTAAGSQRYAADLQQQQYDQSRQDLSQYREVAIGQEIYNNFDDVRNEKWQEFDSSDMSDVEKRQEMAKWDAANPRDQFVPEVTGYTGGALNTLADYGQSRTNLQDYLPDTQIPEYQRSVVGGLPSIDAAAPQYDVKGNIVKFDVKGDIPEYDPNLDIYKDPSYQFRKNEMEQAVNRNAAGMGKVTSGNRLEEIMKRTGEMASQEYSNAYGRMQSDYNIARQNEQNQYGRDVYGYERAYGAETDQFGRDLLGYQNNLALNQLGYGRQVDQYGRAYQINTDQYGRDLTAYNADVAREAGMYSRGMGEFGVAYGQEGDYLNRLASLSNIGQTATNTGVTAGANAAANQGNMLVAAGNTQAAGTLGQQAAYSNALGDITSLTTAYMNQPSVSPNYIPYMPYGDTYNYSGAGGGIPYNEFVR